MKRHRGFTLIEIVLVLTLMSVLSVLLIPSAAQMLSATRLHLAATELAGILRTARAFAIRHSAHVAVRFTGLETGAVSYALYRDGDGDGVLSADIASGVDPALQKPHLVDQLGARVRFGFPPGPRVRDPGSPDHYLRGEDPIRFGGSDLASFDALGGATAGSLYVTDGRSRLAVVRVWGRTGRVRVLTYDFPSQSWQ